MSMGDDDDDDAPFVREYGTKRANFHAFFSKCGTNGRYVAFFAIVALLAAIPVIVALQPGASGVHRNSARTSPHGAVAADSALCSQLGLEALEEGGTAVDAAVVALLCQGVVRPFASGLGGGGFAVVYNARSGRASSVNFRERAPAAATPTMFVNHTAKAQTGPLAVGVPGELCGLHAMHRQLGGNLTWARVVGPAERLARDGFAVDKQMATDLALFNETIFAVPSLRDEFAPNGTMLKEGQLLRRPQLADSLFLIAEYGSDALYSRTGELAKRLAGDLRRAGSLITLDDLASYSCPVAAAQRTQFRNHTVLGALLPASGSVIVAQVLAALELLESRHGDRRLLLRRGPGSPDAAALADHYHLFVEAVKFAFGDRTQLGDPVYANLTGIYPEMLSEQHVAAMVDRITGHTHPVAYYNLRGAVLDDHGTSHLSTMDRYGNAVSITSTVNYAFGAKLVSPSTGFVLNDQMDDFATEPGKPNGFGLVGSMANSVQPGKRPLSSIAPTVVLAPPSDSEPFPRALVALGGSGGPTIPTSVLQTLIHVMNGLDPAAALDLPRLHSQLIPDRVVAEPEFDSAVVKGLEERGHKMVPLTEPFPDGQLLGVVQVISRNPTDGTMSAASDPRKKGRAAAY